MSHEKYTGYWHVVSDSWSCLRNGRYITIHENIRVVDHYSGGTLLGSYKSKPEAETRKTEMTA